MRNITDRQKNIVNPFAAKDYEEYDYENVRNLWVLEGIHDSYINFGFFPQIGKRLQLIGPINENNDVIKLSDARAYAAMYPQNAIVKRTATAKISDQYNPVDTEGLPWGYEMVNPEDPL